MIDVLEKIARGLAAIDATLVIIALLMVIQIREISRRQ